MDKNGGKKTRLGRGLLDFVEDYDNSPVKKDKSESGAAIEAKTPKTDGKICPAVAASCQNRLVRSKSVDRACCEVHSHDTSTIPFVIHNEVKCKVFDEKFCVISKALLVQRM